MKAVAHAPARRRLARRNQRGAFAADWLLVIAAVMGLGGLSAYLVEDYVESLTLERSAEQRDLTAYLDDGRVLNLEHRTVRHAAAAAAAVVEEALSVDPDDPRFPRWSDWTAHFDAKCRRLALSYSELDGFAVASLFLPPLRPENKPTKAEYTREPSRSREPLTAAGLADADSTPYEGGATVADLALLANRKKIMTGVNPDRKRFAGLQSAQNAVFKGAVAWCFLPRSVSAVTAGGQLDEDNLRVQAARTYAAGVGISARTDDPENPGDKALPGTWRNWETYWDAKCRRTAEVFRDLRGFTVDSRFEKPGAVPSPDDLISDRSGRKFADVTAVCEVVAA
ncbi:MAG: hypothetical protein OXP08_09300 [bacterium]|nr:hypothetical protein [bacterium]